MGSSSWAFLVQSQEDVKKVEALVKAHNERRDVGEHLYAGYVLHCDGYYFYHICNGGGRGFTSNFVDAYLHNKAVDLIVFHPWDKPAEWEEIDEEEDIWSDNYKDILATLPAKSPSDPLSFMVPEPAAPPKSDKEELPQLRSESRSQSGACYACGKMTNLVCAKCKRAYACNKACFQKDWPIHFPNCADMARYA